jgi:HK97 gp10 family phage protein
MPNNVDNSRFVKTAIKKIEQDAQFALQAAGIRMLETARERVPRRGQHLATGALAESLRLDVSVPGIAAVYAGVPHAIYNEFGTGPRGAATGAYDVPEVLTNFIPTYHQGTVRAYIKRTGKIIEYNTQGMDAHPFMRPALEAGIAELRKALAAIIKS